MCLLYSKYVSQHPDAQVLRGSDGHLLPNIRTHIGKRLYFPVFNPIILKLILVSVFGSNFDVSNDFGNNTDSEVKIDVFVLKAQASLVENSGTVNYYNT